jgi:glyoxylase-like metal-dependent hydrolase (beta-lactamase superfamily II)
MLQIQTITCNPFAENGYILFDETNECIIIDPGCNNDYERGLFTSFIEKNNLKPVRLINTHCHLDHICGNSFLAKKYNLKLESHKGEQVVLDAALDHGRMFGFTFEPSPNIEIFWEDGDVVAFGNTQLKVLFTPGHSPASISFYSEADGIVMVGDVLFQQGIGRYDLPGGNFDTLINSIQTKLMTLPDKTLVYPGHGSLTKIGVEKMSNPYF